MEKKIKSLEDAVLDIMNNDHQYIRAEDLVLNTVREAINNAIDSNNYIDVEYPPKFTKSDFYDALDFNN